MLISLPKVRGVYRYNTLMSKITWLNVGGQADVLFKPHDIKDLIYLVKNTELPINVIGATSNIIVRDSGIRGITVKLGKEFGYIRYKGNNSIVAGGAALLSDLAHFAGEKQISGLEFLVGIPGTVGGGIEMNAGAYGSDIASVIQSIKAVNLEDGNLYEFSSKKMGYIYRGHSSNKRWIFVEAEFKGVSSEYKTIFRKLKKIIDERNKSQPIRGKTAGCIFKNPKDYQAWKLIDESGCRGLNNGGAKISKKHCNFLLNYNNATASDLETLGNRVKDAVKNKFNVELEWEIRVLGSY
ncbi:UDP-N-acetylmuramate dehydrogenase [Wolbachia endosymbiont of Dirofilaria (Dirofilaria) immitis]|uniref:UDP-N-acetylmuramate dehydrogenase n=1 Tax=Wolbachia endosymbiont of Dirofilaria (Dirofilaria) immitis TaxID=1812115 RepID=UPI00158E9350|nr:UDP-N-acetylmuramate dehydrogenase [Wolbachia endosymbiont of Dirofilaria (Dirofilaria) immitis]QKX02234.1 UDP-N-acetylmuramate dehydrogenase [Wolbachia endosymbiont of Dirofilaria (Dirofilaria) immitis]